jgi:hypothetical protein
MENSKQNPLHKYFRQPKIYIRLPSSGNFYPPGSLEKTESGEYPVYSMTAKDEIVMKTPDALMNGQATVDIIQSCMPNIKDAWKIPSIDLDAILVAIRIATYGEMLDVSAVVPGLNEQKTYEADLRLILDKLLNATFDPVCRINDELEVRLRPLNYAEFTKNSTRSLEEQRIIQIVNDQKLDDNDKLEKFAVSFRKLTEITINMVTSGISQVITPDTVVEDQLYIQDFVNNTDKEILKSIIDHLDEQKKKFNIEPFRVKSTFEEIDAGAPAEFEVPIILDGSNFFG